MKMMNRNIRTLYDKEFRHWLRITKELHKFSSYISNIHFWSWFVSFFWNMFYNDKTIFILSWSMFQQFRKISREFTKRNKRRKPTSHDQQIDVTLFYVLLYTSGRTICVFRLIHYAISIQNIANMFMPS